MYKLQGISKKGDFVLLKDETIRASLLYKSKFSFNATIHLDKEPIEIKTKTRWTRKINIYKKGNNVGNINFNWKSNGIINLIDTDKKSISFLLKRKSFGRKIEIYSGGNMLVFTIKKSKFVWKTRNYNYEINIELDIKYYNIEELFIYAVYVLNLYRRQGI